MCIFAPYIHVSNTTPQWPISVTPPSAPPPSYTRPSSTLIHITRKLYHVVIHYFTSFNNGIHPAGYEKHPIYIAQTTTANCVAWNLVKCFLSLILPSPGSMSVRRRAKIHLVFIGAERAFSQMQSLPTLAPSILVPTDYYHCHSLSFTWIERLLP